ncbi:MAG: hypothetical protein IK999_08930 [Ruminococcus sp.]|nr:hypothetical protein [Ruminococcus sp.]
MANKKNPERINKDFVIRVRVTDCEHQKFIKRAKENGYKTVSDFIRSLIADEPTKEQSVS